MLDKIQTQNCKDFDVKASRSRCTAHRKRILEISQNVTALHVAPAFSCLEMVDTIYFSLMERNRKSGLQDTFVMSKGHGCMAQYVALEALNVISTEELNRYCKKEGILGAHPDCGNPGIEASTGSLGHGLTMSVGMAYADKVLGHDRKVFVVLSDGEMQEGSTWEAMMIAPSLGIKNIFAFLDLNDFQSLGRTSEIHPNFYPILDKIRAFGWESEEVDGHDTEAIYQAVKNSSGEKPFFLVGRTVKGKGVSFMENTPIWHYRSPNAEEYKQAMKELDQGR